MSIFLYGEEITFSADKMNGSTGENSEYTKLSGNAYIKTESMEIKADEIILSGTDFRFINATGNVSGKAVKVNLIFQVNKWNMTEKLKLLF